MQIHGNLNALGTFEILKLRGFVVISSTPYAAFSNCEPKHNIMYNLFAINMFRVRVVLAPFLPISSPRKGSVEICCHGEYV